jgi:flagellar biosynthesis protein FlhB
MSGEKTEQPTNRKLKKAREKGEVFKSSDITHTAVFVVALMLAYLGSVFYLPRLQAFVQGWPQLFSQAAKQADPAQAGVSNPSSSVAANIAGAALAAGWDALLFAMFPLVIGLAAVAIFFNAMQVRGIFSADPLTPKAERLNPGANLKRLFSSRNLVDLVKTLIKVAVIGLIVGWTIWVSLPQWIPVVAGGSGSAVGHMVADALLIISLWCLAVYIFMSAADYGHQFYEYMKQQRMSKDEVRREFKEVEGDPMIRGHRKALMRSMATRQSGQSLTQARVVVTNPTHLSVAIAYTPGQGLPCVVAKGAGPEAMEIRQEAKRLGIPVIERKPLAQKLFARTEVGESISADLFADVANLLAGVVVLPSSEGRDRVGRV